jgi:Glycosyl hydrolases family 28
MINRRKFFGPVGATLGMGLVRRFRGVAAVNGDDPPGEPGSNTSQVHNIRDFGAIGDGVTLDTAAITQAIAACLKTGGGTVIVPAGTFLTGTFRLESNIHLQLEAGARLLASPRLADYSNMDAYQSEGRTKALIYAAHAKNIAITGLGTVDGNDRAFMIWDQLHAECCYDPKFTRQGPGYAEYSPAFPDGPARIRGDHEADRPGVLFMFIDCQNIRVDGIEIVGAPNWCLHLALCDHVRLTDLLVANNLLVPNAGAIDVSKCSNVVIANCDLTSGDDGIAIATCADGFGRKVAENVVVSNCTIVSRSAGIRLGWSTDNIQNCTFQNLVITANRGIGLFARHDEAVQNIIFSNIVIKTRLHTGWWGSGDPVHLSQIPLGTLHGLSSTGKKPGSIRNIQFNNLIVESEQGMVLYAYDAGAISGVTFRNVQMLFKRSPLDQQYGGNFDLRPAFSDKFGVFAHHIPAFYSLNCRGLTIAGFDLKWENDLPAFVTDGIYAEGFENLTIRDFDSGPPPSPAGGFSIHLANGNDATLSDIGGTDAKRLLRSDNVQNLHRFFSYECHSQM